MEKSPIKEALKCVSNPSENTKYQNKLSRQEKKYRDKKSELIEEHNKQIEIYDKKLAKVLENKEKVQEIDCFPIFEPLPLSWLNNDGFPLLAPFSINSPVFSIVGRLDNVRTIYNNAEILDSIDIQPNLPEFMRRLYVPFLIKLYKDYIKYYTGNLIFSIETYFSGLIPLNIVDIIKNVKNLFNDIFIIAEAKKYKIEKRQVWITPPIKIDPDPILIGTFDNKMYLIASFDMTPAEEAAIAFNSSAKTIKGSEKCCMIQDIVDYL